MGAENDAMLSYLEDNARFADLFNQFCFGGKQIVNSQKLEEGSEIYNAPPGDKGGQRSRDIKKRLKSGACLKILALEAQNDVNYIMPWRIMEYDCREYGRQIRKIQRENQQAEERRIKNRKSGKQDAGREEKENIYADAGERLSRFRRKDHIVPVYTICLYHGTEEWDGPRCLRDMVDFGDEEEWEECFRDYPMHLVCVNEAVDCKGFRTSLGALFALLPFRKDKAGLRDLLEKEPVYQRMDEETARTVSVLMGIKRFMEDKDKFRKGNEYNMCQAIREMMEDSRMEGEKVGLEKGEKVGMEKGEKTGLETGIRIFIRSNRDDGVNDTVIADKLKKYYELSQEEAEKALAASSDL